MTTLKSHFTLVEHVPVEGYSRVELDALHKKCTSSSIRGHIAGILGLIEHNERGSMLTLVYKDGELVGGSCYRCKNIGKPTSTCVLYNLFSLAPGAGSAAFQSYWSFARKNSRWFKFFVFRGAHSFYSKYNVKYWGASKTGETFSSLGLMYSDDIASSMNQWNTSFNSISDIDRRYLESNLTIFDEKHKNGFARLKEPHRTNLLSNMVLYKPSSTELEF
jgi:hypothetical protein